MSEHEWISNVRRQWGSLGLYGQEPVDATTERLARLNARLEEAGPAIDPDEEREARAYFRRQLRFAFNDIFACLGLETRVPSREQLNERGLIQALRHP